MSLTADDIKIGDRVKISGWHGWEGIVVAKFHDADLNHILVLVKLDIVTALERPGPNYSRLKINRIAVHPVSLDHV